MDTKGLQNYLNKEFQGRDSFLETILYPIFGEDNFTNAWNVDVLDNEELKGLAQRTGIKSAIKYGTFDLPHNTIEIFEVTVSNRVQMQRNRVNIQQLIRRIMDTYSSAFIIFHYDSSKVWDWRFSFCQKDDKNLTEAKRYTFLLGPGQSCRTAADNFNKLFSLQGNVSREDIIKAFDVEALSKEFFEKYKSFYEEFCQFVYDNKDNREYFGEEFSKWEDKTIRDYVKKLLGRIVFLHFLQKKGWMGVPADKDWGEGDTDFMHQLFTNATESQKNNYLDEILEDLFAKALDTDRTANNDLFDTKVDGFRNVKIPYLNGGLFELDYLDIPNSRFPADLFKRLFEFFYQYNFTIDENDPNDAQVGVDPEMLGRIFENLLEDNKDKGAFYTPKEIVQYMCKESLIAYLQTDVKGEETKDAIRQFVTSYNVDVLGGKESATAKDIDELLKNVKICDPAIGSGAFPMGLLKELFYCRGAIENFDNAAEIKRHIIQQNIYGVDIEKGAVDIARLRFWLSLIVDEKTPHALPNMDFKIMQGNSLLEQYKGFDLSHIMDTKTETHSGHQCSMFDNDLDVVRAEVKRTIQDYYNEQNHDIRRCMREGIQQKIQRQIEIQGINVDISHIKDIAANDQFFLWHTWFSDVFENGGFDIVIGNPPYGVSIKGEYRKTIVDAIGQVPDYEIYYYFIQRSISLIKKDGVLSYIVPNTWLFNTFAKKFRVDLFNTWKINEVLDCSKFKVFVSATVMNSIFVFTKDNINNELIGYRPTNNANSFEDLISEQKNFMTKKQLLSMNQNWGLAFRLSKSKLALVQKIVNCSHKLNEYFECSQGYIPYRLSDLIKNYGEEEGKRIKEERLWHSSNKSEEYWIQELYGHDINKFSYTPTGEYVKYGHHVATYVDLKYFNQKRVVVREITNPCILATIVYDTLLNDPQLLPLISNGTNKYFTYEILWGILNSSLATFYHFNHSPKATKGAFPKILILDLNTFPIPEFNDSLFNRIQKNVEDCFIENQKGQTTQNIERKIDNLIYELYGLTNAEVKIIDPEAQVTGNDNDLFKA